MNDAMRHILNAMLPTRALFVPHDINQQDQLPKPVSFSRRAFAASPTKWLLGHQTAETQQQPAILYFTQYCGCNKIFVITDTDIHSVYGRFDAELYAGTALSGYIATGVGGKPTFYYDNLIQYLGARPPKSLAERIVLAHQIFARRYKKDPIVDPLAYAHRPMVGYVFAQQLLDTLRHRDDAIVFFPLMADQGPPMLLTQ